MNHNLKTAVTAVASVAVVGVAVKNYLSVRRVEQAKRAQIEINKNLDLDAIARAARLMHERMNDDTYFHSHTLADMLDDLSHELKFQKIAIREEF